jgi:hypothetical protein
MAGCKISAAFKLQLAAAEVADKSASVRRHIAVRERTRYSCALFQFGGFPWAATAALVPERWKSRFWRVARFGEYRVMTACSALETAARKMLCSALCSR